MRAFIQKATVILSVLIVCLIGILDENSNAQSSQSPGFEAAGSHLTPSERAGREIWFFATAFNDRFFTYSYPQRLGATIDWYRILAAKNRPDLFQAWGAIPNPDCCVPGADGCPAKSMDETFGFPWCPGDAELLKYVGKTGYRDPACDFGDAPFDENTPHGKIDQRQSACDLRFGTSTGALGLRKFPNPRFDLEQWLKVNGSRDNWDGYANPLSDDPGNGDSRVTRLFDGSVEPPFRIGMACGACHISYDPLNPPADPAKPEWQNIKGLVGNQYSRVSQMLGSGMSPNLLEWQLIARSRPGVVDTSALPMDTVHNPGTMNAIYNFARRPKFSHRVLKWRKVDSCSQESPESCWCEPEKQNKCWKLSEKVEEVQHILKGGEDSIGALEAIQRVYFNIGSCGEQCWLNHVPDLRAIDPNQRNYGQTPFRIGQCRRDCSSFRAIEDRLANLGAYFFSERPTDLWKARGLSSREELEKQLDEEFGEGSVKLGSELFARPCAECHSSQDEPYEAVDFHAVDPKDPTLRIDFLSNEEPVPVTAVGTFAGRAMHSNHMPSKIWDEYAARDLAERKPLEKLKEITKGSGRGYYRPPSLLSLWAYAPFMHNNAIGPEICGRPGSGDDELYSSPYVDENDKPLANPPACVPFDPGVEGRYKLFKDSMRLLLNPKERLRKVNLTDHEIIFDVTPDIKIGDTEASFSVKVPKGYPVVLLNSLRFKDLVQDVVLSSRNPEKLVAKYKGRISDERFETLKAGLEQVREVLLKEAVKFELNIGAADTSFVQEYYSNVLNYVENGGHDFGSDLSDREKNALIAFLATL